MKADVVGRALDTAERADANFVVHVTWALERTPGMMARVRDELVVADSGLPCDSFNFICRARLDGTALRRVVGDAVSYFAQVARPFSWWVGPADQPRKLGAVLEAIGLERAETELAMALRLEARCSRPRPRVSACISVSDSSPSARSPNTNRGH